MSPSEIAALLAPFNVPLSDKQISQLAAYLDLLLRWNARINLTAVRDSKHIVTRHFGESLWTAARVLAPEEAPSASEAGPHSGGGSTVGAAVEVGSTVSAEAKIPDEGRSGRGGVVDVGSGAGFPGLPLKIFAPAIRLTLIESQNKKATFLREVIRTLGLSSADVYVGRAEDYKERAELVTLRAVEKFDSILPVAARLLSSPGSRLAVLIGREQRRRAEQLVKCLCWEEAGTVPLATDRILLIGTKPPMTDRGR